jgi:hypothetical protein
MFSATIVANGSLTETLFNQRLSMTMRDEGI